MMGVCGYFPSDIDDEVLISYTGGVSDELLENLLYLTEKKLNQIEASLKVKKKVFNILVEVFQNIYHHQFYNEERLKNALGNNKVHLLIKRTEKGYLIIAGNLVDRSSVDAIRSRIDTVNRMNREEIKKAYREQLGSGYLSKRGGAGLGMIDIVRKAGQKIEYSFKESTNDFSFFSFKVNVSI
ncbi:SiaB family protein kinase [Xanthovirga aplysinae]|uniref:SiaB family protein kinase n=1 Tax=Xanthovirga aplysinae TaxID=2529853 RepID=UPI0012BB7BE4|nr:SiaB family protein kinase [Xanthovirga aplysinae]MTI31104.1 hypothetical protein [Xanthovirga aplysinae]